MHNSLVAYWNSTKQLVFFSQELRELPNFFKKELYNKKLTLQEHKKVLITLLI